VRAGGDSPGRRAGARGVHRRRGGASAIPRSGIPRLLPSPAGVRPAGGRYGVGHTALREPGDTRGSVAGRKGRYRRPGGRRKEVTERATIKRRYEHMSNVDSLASLRGACERVAPVHPGYANLPIEEGFG